jgi:hypothetical protein
MTVYQLTLIDSFRQRLKQPYDTEAHKALLLVMQKTKDRYQKIVDKCLITDREIFLGFNSATTFASGVGVISFITAELITAFNKKITLESHLVGEQWETPENYIKDKARAMYEVCLENNHNNIEPSLFGSKYSYCLPYEQTPTFFREGIYI